MFGCPGLQHNLNQSVENIKRQDGIQQGGGAGFQQELLMGFRSVQGRAPGLRHVHQGFRLNGKKLAKDRLLNHCVHKTGESHEDAPIFLRLELLHDEIKYRL